MNKTTDQPAPEQPAHGRQQQELEQSRGLPEKSEDTDNHPKPVGPATDAVDAMDAAIEEHEKRK